MYRKILCCFIGIFHNHKSVFQFPLCISILWFCNTPLMVNPAKDCHTLCILHFSCHPTPPHSNIFTIGFFIDTLNLTKWTSLAKALTLSASIRIPCCHCWPLATISVSKSACGLPLLGILPPPFGSVCLLLFSVKVSLQVCWHEIQLMNPFWRIVYQCSFATSKTFFQFFQNSTQDLSAAWYNSFVTGLSAW